LRAINAAGTRHENWYEDAALAPLQVLPASAVTSDIGVRALNWKLAVR
jgi:hypothetical protein